MIRLLSIELQKILYSKTFWILLGLYIVLLAPIAFGFEDLLSSFSFNIGGKNKIPTENPLLNGYSVFNTPILWQNMVYLGSWFKILLALIVITLVTNEFKDKTLRQNIIDGMSKWEIIWAKELVILMLSIFAVFLIVLLTLLLGKPINDTNLFNGSGIVFPYFITLVLYFNFAYFLSSWLKKSGFTFGLLLLYSIVIENLVATLLPESISKLLPINLIDNMVPNPIGKILGKNIAPEFSTLNIAISISYIVLFIMLNYWLLKKGNAGKQ